MLTFVGFATRPPQSEFSALATGGSSKSGQLAWSQKQLIAFGELSIRTIVGYYSTVARQSEVIEERILVDIVTVSKKAAATTDEQPSLILQALGEPLSMKYQCPAQSTWKLAASSLLVVYETGLPIARERRRRRAPSRPIARAAVFLAQHFAALWPTLADVLEDFLFTTSKSETPLNADERKRHEFIGKDVCKPSKLE